MQKISPRLRRKARDLALQALYQWQLTECSVTSIEQQFLIEHANTRADFEYFSELFKQIVTECTELDALFGPFLDRPKADLSPIELAILRIGSYELSKRLEIPFRVVIDEALRLAKSFGATDSYKYINAILDSVARTEGLRSIEIKQL